MITRCILKQLSISRYAIISLTFERDTVTQSRHLNTRMPLPRRQLKQSPPAEKLPWKRRGCECATVGDGGGKPARARPEPQILKFTVITNVGECFGLRRYTA
ncbi:hypothetical protein PUN28_019210 [Cardiocondyla obscurior]|uniref:Uncharacterized protein n=1 Tax=Cardiocondyla obscurior TaxID=286306 RepID=A0AAW2ED57_9HYME